MKKLFIASLLSLLLSPLLLAQAGVVGPNMANWSGNPNGVPVSSLNPSAGSLVLDTVSFNWFEKKSPLGDNSAYALTGDFIYPSGPTYTLVSTSTSSVTGTNQAIIGQISLFGTTTYTIATYNPINVTGTTTNYPVTSLPVNPSPFIFKSFDVLVLSSSAVTAGPIIQARAVSLVSTGTSFVSGTASLTGTATLTGTAVGNYQSFTFTSPGTNLITLGTIFTTSTSSTLTGTNQYIASQTSVTGTTVYTIGTQYKQPGQILLTVPTAATVSNTNGYLNVETYTRGFNR